jgi:hypothetical protein
MPGYERDFRRRPRPPDSRRYGSGWRVRRYDGEFIRRRAPDRPGRYDSDLDRSRRGAFAPGRYDRDVRDRLRGGWSQVRRSVGRAMGLPGYHRER